MCLEQQRKSRHGFLPTARAMGWFSFNKKGFKLEFDKREKIEKKTAAFK